MSALIDIFLEPSKTWLRQKERPTFLVPALLMTLAAAVPALLYFLRVDPDWFLDHQRMALAAQDMGKAEIEQAMKFMPGARASAWIAVLTTFVMMAVVIPVMGAYYLLAGKVAGHALSFRHGLSLTTWAALPMVLGAVVVIVGILSSSPQTTYESLQLTNVDPLLVQLPMDHDWSLLARSFSLLNFWVWFLAALGWKTWTRSGWAQALFVVTLPAVVIFGVMALFAIF